MNETTKIVLTDHLGRLKDDLAKQLRNEEMQADQLRRTQSYIRQLKIQIADVTESLT